MKFHNGTKRKRLLVSMCVCVCVCVCVHRLHVSCSLHIAPKQRKGLVLASLSIPPLRIVVSWV